MLLYRQEDKLLPPPLPLPRASKQKASPLKQEVRRYPSDNVRTASLCTLYEKHEVTRGNDVSHPYPSSTKMNASRTRMETTAN